MKLDQNLPVVHNKINGRASKRNAYHQAGHVVSIYLRNRSKNLPSVHFQIAIKPVGQQTGISVRFARIPTKLVIKLEEGRLITDLPYSYEAATRRLTLAEKQLCQDAFEADIVNLLVGSLAEAKYVAHRDDEVFNANLVYLGALKFYGGGMDLELINEYMACIMPNQPKERELRLAELFLEAYGFINDPDNWVVIKKLAETFVNSPQDIVACEELIDLIESANPINIKFPITTNTFTTSNVSVY